MYAITRSNYYLIKNPINCSRLKTCPDGSIISICQQCKYYKPCPNCKPKNKCEQYQTCPDSSIISKCDICPPIKTCPGGLKVPANTPCPNETIPPANTTNITSELMNFIEKYKYYIIVSILIILLILIFTKNRGI